MGLTKHYAESIKLTTGKPPQYKAGQQCNFVTNIKRHIMVGVYHCLGVFRMISHDLFVWFFEIDLDPLIGKEVFTWHLWCHFAMFLPLVAGVWHMIVSVPDHFPFCVQSKYTFVLPFHATMVVVFFCIRTHAFIACAFLNVNDLYDNINENGKCRPYSQRDKSYLTLQVSRTG